MYEHREEITVYFTPHKTLKVMKIQATISKVNTFATPYNSLLVLRSRVIVYTFFRGKIHFTRWEMLCL